MSKITSDISTACASTGTALYVSMSPRPQVAAD
jgi:hypothetical protein